jgi:predicted small integral membrane protein
MEAPVRRGLLRFNDAVSAGAPAEVLQAFGPRKYQGERKMRIIRLSKTAMVAAIAFFATLTAFGNITDYDTNWAFVQHVLSMDTIDPTATIKYRAIDNHMLETAGYLTIITAETLTAILCWIGAARLLAASADAAAFNRAKGFAVAGLTLGFLLWQVGFMSIGGEWFGMWMSAKWNGVPDAFRFFVTILMVLIYLVLPDRAEG